MAFLSTLPFLNISRWLFRGLREREWEAKTLIATAKYHTQNISILLKILQRIYYWFEKHQCEKYSSVTSHIHPSWGLNPQPGHMSWPGIEPATFRCTGQHSNKLSHPSTLPQCFRFSRSGGAKGADAIGLATLVSCKHLPISSPGQDCFPLWTPSGYALFNTVL